MSQTHTTHGSETMNERARIEQALRETKDALKRATRYSFKFQDHELIAFYHKHIEKLNGLLAALNCQSEQAAGFPYSH